MSFMLGRHNADRVKLNNHILNATKRIDPVVAAVVVAVTKPWQQQFIHFSREDNNHNNNNAAKKCETKKEGLFI